MLKRLILALVLLASAFGWQASAAESGGESLAEMFKGAKGVDFYPKPWPLKNLVTAGQLTVGMTGASPPKEFIDPKTGELTGSSVDIYRQLASDLGLKINFVKLDWAGVLPGLTSNRFDMGAGGCSWTTERLASESFFVTDPHTVGGNVGLTLKSSGITDWAGTKGKQMGGITGEIETLDARAKLKGVGGETDLPGTPEAMLALQNGQVDFIIVTAVTARFALQNAPNRNELMIVGPPLSIFPQGLCVNPREGDLLKAVNVLLGNYRADGTLKTLVARYGGNPDDVDTLKQIGY
jgi:ABC-type amino acid transport substrate-binding protein